MRERDDELAAIDRALHAAREGSGALLLVEGPAGIGKTALLSAAVGRAGERAMRVLTASGDELERSFPYTVVRQLFEAALDQADDALRDALLAGAAAHAAAVVDPRRPSAPEPPEPSAVLHGLYWLVANLAAGGPVAIVVDDLHWSDHASLSWLAYVARRLEGLPVALLLGTRAGEPGADEALLDRLRTTQGAQHARPAPLSEGAVDGLAHAALGERVDPAFGAACHAATQGNPFYVAELLRALRENGAAGTSGDIAVIEGLTPRAVVAATLARLGNMAPPVRAIAEAVALMEPHAELRWIAELTGLEAGDVAAGADALVEIGMLRSVAPCRFEHPILRSAVESEVAPARRGLLHLQAARTLAAAGLPVESVAAHLMQTAPSGEAWVLDALERAAARASDRGAPDGAAAFLERALAERPEAARLAGILLDLGRAEARLGRASASAHLHEALALATEPDQAALIALLLAQALFFEGDLEEACDVTQMIVERHDGHDSQRMLELQAYLVTMSGPAGRIVETAALAASLEARTPAGSIAAGAVNAALALRDLVAGEPRARVRSRAERAVAGLGAGAGASATLLGRDAPGMAFLWVDDLDRAEQLFSDAIASASQRGSPRMFENFSALRGYTSWRGGHLANAAADIEPVLASAAQGGKPGIATLLALVAQVLLLVELGQPAGAEALAGFVKIPPSLERVPIVAMLRHAQATAQLAVHKPAEAIATLTLVAEVCEANAIRCPTMVPWRSELALALAGGERDGEARRLARDELALAERCDVDRARGRALRAIGMLEGGDAGIGLLDDAVGAFERSPARLELGWACFELGAALRRAGRRRDARAPLDRALDLALACGATRLGEHASEELEMLGARPRSVMRTGAQALTPSERRVCRMAADGLKNAEIAQALFVSLKTVETHLRSAFRKLDVTSRTQLGQALGGPA